METVEQIFQKFFASPFVADRVSCVWHAGEPMVLPVDFYRQAFALQEKWNKQGITIINSFQTNGTLIDQQWCDFFLEHGMRIGISIDGPQYLHDAHRVDRGNHGTFERVMRGIELLRKNNMRFSAIAVVTSDTVQHADDFWQFFADLMPTRLGLNPEEVEGCNEHSSLHTSEGVIKYKSFIQRLLTLNTQSQQPLVIREIDALMKRILSGRSLTRTETNTPISILSFDYQGNISTFSPELLSYTHQEHGRFVFGNVFHTALEDITKHAKYQAVDAAIQQGIVACQESCEYFALCGGGAPSNKLHENGSFASAETNACRLRIKATTDTLLNFLEETYSLTVAETNADIDEDMNDGTGL
jgi:uncharacterized protein